MNEKHLWRTEDNGTTGWHGRFRLGRSQVGWRVWRHHSGLISTTSDRWVFHPYFIYDRKEVSS